MFTLLVWAAIIYGAVQLVKYFIRYGIDYYFKKLKETQKASPSGNDFPRPGENGEAKRGSAVTKGD